MQFLRVFMVIGPYFFVGSKNHQSWFNRSELAVFVSNVHVHVAADIVFKLGNTKQEQRISDALCLLSITWRF